MNILKLFKGTAEEVRLNPNIGTFSWFLHRISGVLLLIYLFIHLWVLGSAQSGTAAFDARLRMVQSPLFHFLEIGLVFVIFYHMINGLSITVMDFFNLSARHKTLVTVSVTIFAVVAIIALSIMLPRALHIPSGGTHAIS
ncbi:MAG: succinate dehydrogenase, cytochrome b556 subunit [candidate division Zixibacteria bacterium RBG_16_53_22]|nr:MAG: succinate dehydrogenase, cytochrome b556 subunit [candidate division Zixibacteria bacterium RBG_16_53_22]